MEEKEIRRIASEVDEYFKKKNKNAEERFSRDMNMLLNNGALGYKFNGKHVPNRLGDNLMMFLENGGNPSEFFKMNDKLMTDYIDRLLLPYMYISMDSVDKWQVNWESYYRQSFRMKDQYAVYFYRIIDIIKAYRSLTNIMNFEQGKKYSLVDIMNLNVSERLRCYLQNDRRRREKIIYFLTALLDDGNPVAEKAVEDIFYGDSGDMEVHYIRAIVMSHNKKMYEILGNTLLAAKLSEGLRQAIVENIDYGTIEAFTYMLEVINDNSLIRFTSVKRAVMTFTGLGVYDTRDVDRITAKELNLIVSAMKDKSVIEEYLASEDSMKIYIALWALGGVSLINAIKQAYIVCMKGTEHQRKVGCFFLKNIYYRDNLQEFSKEIVKKYKDDQETLALIFGRFMPNVGRKINDTVYTKSGSVYYESGDGFKPRVYADLSAYFENEKECREFYDILKEIYEALPKKGAIFEPSVFPWNKAELSRGDVAIRMIFCASALKDKELIIESAALLKDLESDWGGDRKKALELLLREPDCPELLDILTNEVADAETRTRSTAYELLKQELETDRSNLNPEIAAPAGRLPERCYDILEDMLRLKRSDIRKNVLSLLKTRRPEEKLEMLERLFNDGKEEKVTAGLDIIMQLKKDNDAATAAAIQKLELIRKPTTKEKILIDEIRGVTEEVHLEQKEFYDKNAGYIPQLDSEYVAFVVEKFLDLFPDSDIVKVLTKGDILDDTQKAAIKSIKPKGILNEKRLLELLEKLNQLIEDNKDREYPVWNGTALLGNSLSREYINGRYADYPFMDLWNDFREKNDITISEIRAISIYMAYSNAEEVIGFREFFDPMLGRMLGFRPDFKKLEKFRYISQMITVFNDYFIKSELPKNAKYYSAAAALYLMSTKDKLIYNYKPDQIRYEWKRRGADPNTILKKHIILHTVVSSLLNGIRGDVRNFPINHLFIDRIYLPALEDDSMKTRTYGATAYNTYNPLMPIDYVKATAEGYISKDYMYKMLLSERNMSESVKALTSVIRFVREANMNISTRNRTYSWHTGEQRSMVQQLLDINLDEESLDNLNDKQRRIMEIADEAYKNVTDMILGTELVRGDTETEYSKYIYNIKRIYGSEYLVKILSALGKDTLDRSTYHYTYYSHNISKKESLSHLLSVCIPDPKDGTVKEQTAKLKELLKGIDVSESRLIEAGLYSPEWLPIIGEYLGWEGFTSGCYYFMAHMNENFDDKRKAIIAKYTPLSSEDLNNGAFDVDWFNEVYEQLGKKRFDAIYKAAKYISDGAKHSRARKYADAARGEMDVEKTTADIEAKRNKDLLMAYALIPAGQIDAKTKYQFIQKYLKGSKQFGAQRRASERAASEMAVKNLAKVEGYNDETRFILKMERDISTGLVGFLEPHEVGEYLVWLEVDDSGKVSVNVKKGDKKLKSVPAALKKDEYIVDLNEAKKTFTEQYRRTKIMMEESMESENEYFVSEILDMAKDPVIGKLVGRLLFKKDDFFGFPEDIEAQGFKDTDTLLVAHPSHLFKAGRWHEFQKICYDRQIKQPFKQIFRELYVMTDEEKNLTESMRYAGNQINPQQTVGVLRGRRWIADAEDGLQKVYYKENIIATIYALADWFSPSDIEAPTLEWVAFYDRKTFERKPICEIPDIIYSEVMRDVDLAVSVAHAGQIDPEMSHSTIEMRRAIAEFVVPMFKLSNVTFTDSHALIKGTRGNYTIHLGSGVIHQEGGPMINVLPVHSQSRGRIFLPFVDDDPKTSEIMSKIIFFAEDKKIKDPFILDQIVKLD